MINLFSEEEQLADKIRALDRLLQSETDSEERGAIEQRQYELCERHAAVTCLINQGRLSASEEEIQAAK